MLELTISQTEYLKAIYAVSLKGEVKVTKIADYLSYSKPSVIRALKSLQEIDLIVYNQDEIKLTNLGIKYAKNIMRKDNILQKFLVEVLEVNPILAKKDAENMKHGVSCYTINKLENYLSNILNEKISNEFDYCLCENSGCDTCLGEK